MYDLKIYNKLTEKINKIDNGCWEFNHSLNNKGYGRISCKFESDPKIKNYYAHRAMWISIYGPEFEKPFVCHRCDNPKCINPKHLFLGNNSDNMLDCNKKGRANRELAVLKYRGENHPRATITEKIAIEIKELFKNGMRFCDISKKYGIHKNTVLRLCRNQTWKHINV